MFLSKFAKDYLTVPIEDPSSNIMKIQMPAWIAESHCWEKIEPTEEMKCIWCGAEHKEPITYENTSLCLGNPYIQKMFGDNESVISFVVKLLNFKRGIK